MKSALITLYRLLISLWTLEVLIALTVAICLAGSLMLPTHLALFSGIDDTPLFQWLAETGSPDSTWWIYAMMACLGVLSLATFLCTVDALIKAAGRKDFLHRLYPQMMHMGVLLVMAGHLLTAWLGVKQDLPLMKGQSAILKGGIEVTLTSVGLDADMGSKDGKKKGYYDDWIARLNFSKDGVSISEAIIKPVQPVTMEGNTLLFKSITLPPRDSGKSASALLRVVRDPGALWALAGGIVLVLGGAGFISTRGRMFQQGDD